MELIIFVGVLSVKLSLSWHTKGRCNMDKKLIIDRLDKKAYYLSHYPDLKINGEWGQTKCNFNGHQDNKPSLFVNLKNGSFHCKGCGDKGSLFDHYMKVNSVDYRTAFNALAKEAGLTTNNTPERTHVYHDEAGNLIYRKLIYKYPNGNKSASFERCDGGKWIKGLERIKRTLYQLHKLKDVSAVFLCESEKDCDNLISLGFTATTSGGAESWKDEFAEYLKGKEVIILPHNDIAGNNYAQKVARSLNGKAFSIKIVDAKIFGDFKGADVSDWISQGGTKEKLTEIINAIPEWIPEEPKTLISSLLKWNDILSLDVKTEYILEKLIPKSSITLLFGRGGIGKTSLCMQIARAIASGLSFDVLKTIASPVYYIDFENPLAVLKERVEKIGQSENLYVWHISNEIQPPKLDSTGWDLYKQLPPGLLIVDTLRASHLSDENDSKPMSLIMGRLKELREIGFTILLLHHTPKGNENTFKGSTALLDLCDHVLGLEEVKDSENETIEFDCRNLFKLGTRIKTRYEPHSIYLTFNPEIKGFSVAVDPDIEKMEGIQEILNQAVEPLKQKELREKINKEMDLPDKEIRKLLKKGTGLYWNTEKGDKNATIYTPLNSVCQFGNTIYTGQTDKQESATPETLTNRPLADNEQSLENAEFGSFSEGIGQTEKQTVIDLEHEEVEIVE